jgi:hypothetical protein
MSQTTARPQRNSGDSTRSTRSKTSERLLAKQLVLNAVLTGESSVKPAERKSKVMCSVTQRP